jgi:hypothetical protein
MEPFPWSFSVWQPCKHCTCARCFSLIKFHLWHVYMMLACCFLQLFGYDKNQWYHSWGNWLDDSSAWAVSWCWLHCFYNIYGCLVPLCSLSSLRGWYNMRLSGVVPSSIRTLPNIGSLCVLYLLLFVLFSIRLILSYPTMHHLSGGCLCTPILRLWEILSPLSSGACAVWFYHLYTTLLMEVQRYHLPQPNGLSMQFALATHGAIIKGLQVLCWQCHR